MREFVLSMFLVSVAGCGGTPPNLQPFTKECARKDQPACGHCCTDSAPGIAQCENGTWVCPSPYVDIATCTQSCAPPSSTKKVCVDRDAGVCLPCGGGEFCVSAFRCAPGGDGGTECGDAPDAGAMADDRCHGLCNWFDQCGAGETCSWSVLPIGCSQNATTTHVCL